jgi:hypothetical protein
MMMIVMTKLKTLKPSNNDSDDDMLILLEMTTMVEELKTAP